MTLGDISKKTMKILEEYSENGKHYTGDADFRMKFIGAYNDTALEVSKISAINGNTILTLETAYEEKALPSNCRTVVKVTKDGKYFDDFFVYGGNIYINGNGDFVVYYDAIPQLLTDNTAETTLVPFNDEVASIMPYGIVKLLLLGTGDYNTSTEFEQKYYTFLQELKKTTEKVKIKVVRLYGE